MSLVPFGRVVRLVTDKSTARGDLRIGLEALEKETGRLLPDIEGDYEGDGIMFQQGDVLFGKLRPNLRKSWLATRDGDAVGDFHVYRARSKSLTSRYLAYIVRSEEFVLPVVAAVTGARMPRADWREVRGIPVWIPTPNDQRAIADYLDRETAQIDAFIAKNEELISLLTERYFGATAQLTLQGLDPSTEMKETGIPWLGEVPRHWQVSRLSRWFSVTLGKMLDEAKFSAAAGDHRPYIRASNIKASGLDLDDVKVMPFSDAEVAKYSLRRDDLLVVEGGSIGVNAWLASDMPGWGFQKTVNRVRDRHGDRSRFLGFQVDAIRRTGALNAIANVSTIQHLTAEKLERLLIAMPPAEEQDAIIKAAIRATDQFDAAIATATRAIELARERRSALISAAVTGKIDVGVAA